MMQGPPGTSDLERLVADIEEALIALIDRPPNEPMINDLQRRKSHLLDEIERLGRQFGANARPGGLH